VIIGDSLGSLLVYDSLCQSNNLPNVDTSSLGSNHRTPSPNPIAIKNQLQQQQSTSSSLPVSPSPMSIQANNANPLINISDTVDTPNNLCSLKRTGSSSSKISNSSGSELSPMTLAFLSPPATPSIPMYINSAQSSYDERLDFDVTHFFVLGSPLGLILASRKLSNNTRKRILAFFSSNF
jgi:hypothetical protein